MKTTANETAPLMPEAAHAITQLRNEGARMDIQILRLERENARTALEKIICELEHAHGGYGQMDSLAQHIYRLAKLGIGHQAPEPIKEPQFIKRRLHYITDECSTGFVLRPRDKTDVRRWHFDSFLDAESHADYLERTHNAPIIPT